MPGAKGRSGGAGRGQGRIPTDQPVQSLHLSPEHQQKLAIITRWRRMMTNNPRLSQRHVIEAWIDEHWAEVDEAVLIASEEYEQAVEQGIQP